MSEEIIDQVELRKYLLGILDEAQTEEIEKLLVSDDKCFQELQIIEAEIIQDFADGKLSKEEKRAFNENFIITDERREQINFARALRKLADENSESQPEKQTSFFDSLKSFFFSPIPVLCSVLIVVGISLFVWWNYSSHQSEVLVALNNAQKNERPTESRISDLNYAPKTEGTRSGNAQTQNEELDFAELKARTLTRENATAENLHELGRVYLAQKKFDAAITEFEKAIKLNPNIAKINNDLGAALMEKGNLNRNLSKENDPKDKKTNETKPYLELFAQANERFSKAIELDKNNLESNFNQALCIEALGLPNPAKEAWENYLKLDSTSKWADEARERLKKLEENKPISKTKEQVLQEFLEAKEANDREKAWQVLSRNREMITGKLIPQQLAFLFVDSKTTNNEPKAKEALDALVYAGKLEEEKSGDLFWRDLAKLYSEFSDKKISIQKEAHSLMLNAYGQRNKNDLKMSIEYFVAAKNKFNSIENQFEEKICDYWIATILFQLNDLKKSNLLHLALVKFSEDNNYKWLATQSLVRLGYGVGSETQYSKSVEYNEKAFKYSQETNDLYNLQRASTSLAKRYRKFGRYDVSFSYLEKSLQLNSLPESSQRQKWLDYEAITETFTSKQFYHSAILFQEESFSLAQKINDEYYQQTSKTYLGIIYLEQQEFEKAEKELKESIARAEQFTDEQARIKSLSYSKLNYAHLKRLSGNFAEAIAIYQESNNFHSSSEFQLNKYEGQKGELLCYLATKNDLLIKQKLPDVLKVFEENRKTILEEQNRNSFFDNEQDIYDIAVEYEFGIADYTKAFDYAERSRSRSLLDIQNTDVSFLNDATKPEIKFSSNFAELLKLDQIQSEMSDKTQVLAYYVLPKKVVFFLVTKNDLITAETIINNESLQEKVSHFLNLLSNFNEQNEQLNLAKELYETLILPIKDKLDRNKQLLIIPDKVLFNLPFAALYKEKYLVEEFQITYSPSSNVFLNCSRKAKDFNLETPENLLSVGNPTFNSSEYKNILKPLPSAKEEVIEISKFYETTKILVEEEADKLKIKESLKKADIFHFAGHYLVNQQNPLLSSFVVAGDKNSNLANFEIISEKLARAKLIVLSACETGIEKYYKGEGMIGASRIFLAANVPLVVASQWAIESEATKVLMIEFHRLRKIEKLPTPEALRQAQIKMIRAGNFNQPYYWAAFITLGGYAQF